jgi:hypothetical protein
LLAGWLGLEVSYGLLDAAGRLDPADADKPAAEEAAVLAVQRFMRLAGGTLPVAGVGATGKVMNDDNADWREAWALFPGDVAYVWHAGYTLEKSRPRSPPWVCTFARKSSGTRRGW